MAYQDGTETGRCRLHTADAPARLELLPGRPHLSTDPQDLAYLGIRLVDEHGTINPISDRIVTVTVRADGLPPATVTIEVHRSGGTATHHEPAHS